MSVQGEPSSQCHGFAGQIDSQSEVEVFSNSETDAAERDKRGSVLKDQPTKNEKSKPTLKELNSNASKTRQSSRERHLTPKMQELKEQELSQKEKFKSVYEKWKIQVRDGRTTLKHECSESELYDMMDVVEKLDSELKDLYDSIRLQTAPSQEIRRKVDTCSAITADLLGLMRIRLTEEEEEFNAEAEKSRLCMLLNSEYARSIYGSTVSRATALSHRSNHLSESPSLSAKRAETAAQLAAKKAEVEMQGVIDAQRQELKRL